MHACHAPTSLPLDLGALHEIGDRVPLAFDGLARWAAPASPPAILVVDGDPDVRLRLERLVQHLAPDYDIIASTNLLDALDRIRGRIVPLVLTDVGMPLLDSLRLVTCVNEQAPETHALLLTVSLTATPEQRGRHQGIEPYLPKPFADLERLVDAALGVDAAPVPQPHRPS
jgi:CheY-like chemotaxis protein